MTKSRIDIFKQIFFWGVLWGVLESSLGFILHYFHLPLIGLLLFPVGFFCMYMAAKSTGKSSIAMSVAVVAATIKLSNLFFTPILLDVINPVFSILLEGAVSFLFLRIVQRGTVYQKSSSLRLLRIFSLALIISFSWHIIFVLFQNMLVSFVTFDLLLEKKILNFLIYDTLVSTLFITALTMKNSLQKNLNHKNISHSLRGCYEIS